MTPRPPPQPPRPPLPAAPARGAPALVGAIVGSGQATRAAVEAGADLLLALSAGAYRHAGVGSLAPFLPFRNSNDLALEVARDQVLPRAAGRPVAVGLLSGDPTQPLEERLDELRALGVAAVANYPSIGFLDGAARRLWEAAGATLEAEIELLNAARERGFATLAFGVTEPEAARRLAAAGVDALVLTVGVTRELDDIHERRDRVARAIARLDALLEAARSGAARPLCFAFGGPLTTPEDVERLLDHVPFDGFVGGSVFEGSPALGGMAATIRGFRQAASRRAQQRSASSFGSMVGESAPMLALYRLIERAAAFDLHVLVEGESGTGKELVAQAIHRESARSHGPLVTLNCGAIPDALLESELFGHEKGAFTGAVGRRLGKLELADGGTLLLDEIADLSARGQVALLRAIQQQEITRVGGERARPVDVRIVAASNRPLRGLVEAGVFRADLYYRLNNVTLRLPPLRERLEDLPLLATAALDDLRGRLGREPLEVSDRFLRKLRRHGWPGNVRELQHAICQAALLEDGPVLEGKAFEPEPFVPGAGPSVATAHPAESTTERRALAARRAVQAHDGNKSRAAAWLGVSRKTLYAWLRTAAPDT